MVRSYKSFFLLISFFSFVSLSLYGQDQKKADSLLLIYNENTLTGKDKLELLRDLSFNEAADLDASIKYAEELIVLAQEENDPYYIMHGYMQKGHALRIKGEFDKALNAMFKSAEVAIQGKLTDSEGSTYLTIADVYSEMGNSVNAEAYYDKAILILRATTDSLALATALLNSGDEYFNTKKYVQALKNYEESGEIFKQLDYPSGNAYNLGNIGMVYAAQGNAKLAKENINKAISILEDLEDYYAISEYLIYMSDIFIDQNDFENALSYAKRSLDLAEKYGMKKQMGESNLQLSEVYEAIGNIPLSFDHYKKHVSIHDDIINLDNIKKMANERTNFEVSQRDIKIDLLNAQKRNQLIIVFATGLALLLIAVLAIGLFRRNKFIQKTKKIIETEKNRSEQLLLNILPDETAQELKLNGKVKARKFDSVSVLFTDFKGFTKYAEKLAPEELVETVDYYFSKFDEIMDKYALEKIKTIGDSYMSTGGLHPPEEDHAQRMIMAAFDILKFVEDSKKPNAFNQTPLDIRIGINTGPVVAGVVGFKKYAYDIWGDAVNIASRMESNGDLNKINISEFTYELVKDIFDCEYRGKIEVKNRGLLKMYFVNGLKNNTSYSEEQNTLVEMKT
ncbi:MAG: tetratricopeptide repeat protein [Bacteroidia bacterium]|nr:tetratricopeptide repeat protein [Bacteroidia bacterium]MBT8277507.1 tetratricopeptide repeat protein [Bacteroidia bacterium]NNK60608.1 tetratricopeptide repeat protein [Flavobacteriaceae bacterium]